MSQELTITLASSLVYGSEFEEEFLVDKLRVDQQEIGLHSGVFYIGTAQEVLPFGDVASPGYAFFRNVDTEEIIYIGPGGGDEYGYSYGTKDTFAAKTFASSTFASGTWAGSGSDLAIVNAIALDPGDVALFRLYPGVTLRAFASGADARLKMLVLES